MKLDTITIKKLSWKVIVEDPKTTKEPLFEEIDLGATVFCKKNIHINSCLDLDLFYETLKHELTHAYMFSYGFEQVKLTEEVMCDFLASYADDIIEQAKDLLKKWENHKGAK